MRRWAGVVTASLVVLLALLWSGWSLAKSRHKQLFGKLVTRVATDDAVVALTFDDGPQLAYTDSVLAILADSGVHATFFVIGKGVATRPDIAQRIVRQGHELGNHSYSHRRMLLKTPRFVRRELEQTDSLIKDVGHSGAIHFRPPFGKRLVVLPWVLSRTGRTTVLWDVEPDSDPAIAHDSGQIIEHVMQMVRPGSIILLHAEVRSRAPARPALPSLIGRLRAAGYRFVTVSELLRGAISRDSTA